MLEVTEAALRLLHQDLVERGAPQNIAMRLSQAQGGLRLLPDEERLGDRGFDVDERTVLVIDHRLVEAMSDLRLGVARDRRGRLELQLEHRGRAP